MNPLLVEYVLILQHQLELHMCKYDNFVKCVYITVTLALKKYVADCGASLVQTLTWKKNLQRISSSDK